MPKKESPKGARKTKLSTDPYKGVRDFYPEDMFIQNYLFDTMTDVGSPCGRHGR
jgi:histidyl-tRNA synthetase